MRIASRRLSFLGAALVLIAALAAATALAKPPTHPVTVKPGKDPTDISPHHQAPAGTPGPGKLHTKPASFCADGPQPGTVALQRYLDHWFLGHSDGIYNCRGIGGTNLISTHSEGRALDWHLLASVPRQKKAAMRIVHYFLSKDDGGIPRAMAKRWGLQMIIYNDHIWSVTHNAEGFRPCNGVCPDPHTTHLHIEQNWRGAHRRTSAYTGWTFQVPDTF